MKENHHYVPQFYLRYFSHNKKSIGTYIYESSKYIKYANIRRQASGKKLYGNTEDIENMLMTLEHKVSIIINNIIDTLSIPSIDSALYHELLFFIMISMSRVIKSANDVDSIVDKLSKLIMKNDANFEISKEEMDSFKVGMDIPNLLPMQAAAKSYPAILDLRPILLVSKCDRQFITSDSPVTKYNLQAVKRDYFMRGYGLTSAGLQIFYPITPKIMLMLYDERVYDLNGEKNGVIELKKGKDIDELNKLTFLDSYKYLYFNSSINEKYIYRVIKDLTPTFNLEKNFSEHPMGEGTIIGVHGQDTRVNINISFIKVKFEFMTCPLPSHMAGLTRPVSQAIMKDIESFNFLHYKGK